MVDNLGQGEMGKSLHLENRAGKGLVGVAAVEDELLMIAAQEAPSLAVMAVDDHSQASAGQWAAIDDIPADDDEIGRPRVNVSHHRFERGQIAVDIRQDRYFHFRDYSGCRAVTSRKRLNSILTNEFDMLASVFVFLSKFLPLFVFPLGFITLLLIAAVLWRRGRRALLLVAIAILWLGSSRYVAYALIRDLENRYPPLPPGERADAIVVLGGGTRGGDPPRPIVEVNEAGDRLLYGASLYHAGAAPVVLVTGGGIEWLTPEGVDPEANDMSSLMDLLGVPPEAVWLESRSRNTYENALYSREMLTGAGMESILLVTSAMHMPRSVPLFEAQGLHVTPAPTDFLVSDAEWQHLWRGGPTSTLINLLPNVEYLTYTTRAMKEYMGLVVYGFRGWL